MLFYGQNNVQNSKLFKISTAHKRGHKEGRWAVAHPERRTEIFIRILFIVIHDLNITISDFLNHNTLNR